MRDNGEGNAIMTKREFEKRQRMFQTLNSLGITKSEFDTLRRCSMALRRWGERECGDGSNWAIERDENTGITYNVNHETGSRYRIPDRESGALKRAKAILDSHGLTLFHQTDCRGAAIYVIRPQDVIEGENVDSYYSRGIAVY
jgi:hypothetical protein